MAARHLLAQCVGQDAIERDRIGRMRHAVGGRIERMPAANKVRTSSGGNSAWVTTASIGGGAGGAQRLGAGDQRAARGHDVVDQQHRTAGEQRRDRQRRSRPSGRRGASCCADRVGQLRAGRKIARPRPRFCVGTDHDRCGIDAGSRAASPRSPAWPTDCRPRCPERRRRMSRCDADARRR